MAPRETVSTDWQVNYPEIKMRSAHLLRSREWADCTFQFETRSGDAAPSLEAHRLILAMASPVFAAMFYGHVGDKQGPIHISDIDNAVFSSMLDYIYTDEVEITSLDMASDLFRAANKYILVHLERKCINYLLDNLCPQKACYLYELSCMYNEEELKLKCVEMFHTKTLDILKASSFKDAQLDTVKMIYSLDTLNIDSELDLFEALVEYTKKNKQINCDGADASESHEDNKVSTIEDQQIKNEAAKYDKSTDTEDLNKNTRGNADNEKEHVPPVRKNIPGLVEQIRFLTLTVLELTECKNLSLLLTEPEILALMFKISSPRYSHKIPEGFSKSTISRSLVDKHRLIANIEVKIENISTVRNENFNIFGKKDTLLHSSNIFYVMNVPWQFFVWRRNINISMYCNKDGCKKDKTFKKSEETSELFVGLQCLILLEQNNNNLDESECDNSSKAFCEVEIELNQDYRDEHEDIPLVQSQDLLFKSCSWAIFTFPRKMLNDRSLGVVSDDDVLFLNVTVQAK